MKETTRLLGFLLLLALFAGGGFLFGRRTAIVGPESTIIHDTVSCTIYDTIVFERPAYRVSYVTDTVATYFTTIEHDTVLVDVPIERRVYAEDSVYRAVLSGWRPRLDSLTIYPTTTTVTITNTILPKSAKWLFGITAGPSVLATPSGSVHAGLGASVGLTYRF